MVVRREANGIGNWEKVNGRGSTCPKHRDLMAPITLVELVQHKMYLHRRASEQVPQHDMCRRIMCRHATSAATQH
jgi:hypothetical protein